MKNKLLFIINPVSGIGKQKTVEKAIVENLDLNKFEYQIEYTEYAGHATQIAKNAIGVFEVIVAVGGDGSINETAKSLIETETILAIIPTGSGNGLARHLKIPLKVVEAIKTINQFQIKKIDVLKINNEYSFNVSGLGFDALISHKFAKFGTRGFLSYAKLVFKEFSSYKSIKYKVEYDGISENYEAFMLSFANSSQFGNNALISPKSKIDDGKFELVILKKIPILYSVVLAFRLFSGTIHKSKFVKTISINQLKINNQNEMLFHIDGDPFIFNTDIEIVLLKQSLNIVGVKK